jgi:hypothetical protein
VRDKDVSMQEEDEMGSSKNSQYVPTWRLTSATPVRFLRFSPGELSVCVCVCLCVCVCVCALGRS